MTTYEQVFSVRKANSQTLNFAQRSTKLVTKALLLGGLSLSYSVTSLAQTSTESTDSSFSQTTESSSITSSQQNPDIGSEKVPIVTQTLQYKTNLFNKALPDQVSYFSDHTGPALGGQGDPVDENGKTKDDSINTWNQISFQWNMTKKTRFVVNPRFTINHNPDPNTQDIEYVDPVFGVVSTWYESGNFSFGGGLNTILPMTRSESALEDNLLFNPGGFNVANYQISPAWSVGSWIWARANFFDGNIKNEEKVNFLVAPITEYAINDSFKIGGFYWINGAVESDDHFKMLDDDSYNIIATITINKMITLQPFVTFYENNGFDISQANFKLWFFGRLF